MYMAKHARKHKRSWRADERAIRRNLLPAFGQRRAADVRAVNVEAVLTQIMEREAPMMANRVFALVRRIYSFGLKHATAREQFGLVANPCAGVSAPAKERARDRVLDEGELRSLWKALDAEDTATAAIFRLCLLTAQRSGEVMGMRRAEVNVSEAMWTIPDERSKNGLAHRVPLSDAALAIVTAALAAHDSPWLFPSTSTTGHRVKTEKAMRRLRRAMGVEGWRAHDTRRSAASHMAKLGVQRLVLGRILNHQEPGVTKVYDRYGYDREKRQALDAWARRLHAIVTGEAAAKVVPLRSA